MTWNEWVQFVEFGTSMWLIRLNSSLLEISVSLFDKLSLMSYKTWNYSILYFTPLDVKNITLNHKTIYGNKNKRHNHI